MSLENDQKYVNRLDVLFTYKSHGVNINKYDINIF